MAASPTDEDQILTALDADAGWQAAANAEQRERALLVRCRVQFNAIEIHRPKIQAWNRIVQILIKDDEPEEVIRLIREEIRKANSEAEIRAAQLKKTDQKADRQTELESREAPRAWGVSTHV
jgi:hypothetical protein